MGVYWPLQLIQTGCPWRPSRDVSLQWQWNGIRVAVAWLAWLLHGAKCAREEDERVFVGRDV